MNHDADPADANIKSSQPLVLILGANGRLGAAAVRAFAGAGWRVLAQARRAPATLPVGAAYVATPLTDRAGLAAAAKGARAVLYAVNQPYGQWATQALPDAKLAMDVAQRLDATFLFPGNVYNFGTRMPALLRTDTPQQADTRKGRIRVALEAEMRLRCERGLRSVVLRAGDYFGAGSGAWFDLAIVKSLVKGKLVYPGPLDRPHAWAYVPDLARAFVAVAQRGERARGFSVLHFEGHTLTGAQLLAAIERAAAPFGLVPQPGLRRSSLPWALIRACSWFVPPWREIAELAYLWSVPHALVGGAGSQAAGPFDTPFDTTPIDTALSATLRALQAPGTLKLPSSSPATRLTPLDGA